MLARIKNLREWWDEYFLLMINLMYFFKKEPKFLNLLFVLKQKVQGDPIFHTGHSPGTEHPAHVRVFAILVSVSI